MLFPVALLLTLNPYPMFTGIIEEQTQRMIHIILVSAVLLLVDIHITEIETQVCIDLLAYPNEKPVLVERVIHHLLPEMHQ